MSRLAGLLDGARRGIRRVIREEHLRTWDRNGGPGGVLRVAMQHPLATAAAVGGMLAAVLVATFGVPPFSPLALIVIVVAPIVPWLGAERAVYDEWLAQESGRASAQPPEAGAPDESEDPEV